MWYKRYGYKGVKHSGGETLKVFLALPVVIIVCCGIAALFRNAWFLLLIFPLSIGSFELIHRAAINEGQKFREIRKSMHVRNAFKAYKENEFASVIESIRKVEIYGELPNELVAIRNKIHREKNA